MDVDLLRDDFPALRNYTWFQNGGVSITPRPVHDHLEALMGEILQRGPMHIVYPDEEYPRRKRSIERLARFFDTAPDTLAVMRGVSEGFQTVIRGIDWRSGDRIIITADEEAALLLPALHLRDSLGVEVVKLPLLADSQAQLAALDENINEGTRLIALSHVTTDIGHRLPVKELCSMAEDRGILSFVDMAHSAGLYGISLPELSCDFAGILSYKWMYAPYASGLLYVRPGKAADISLRFAGGRSEAWLDFEKDTFGLKDTAERFQFGPWSWPLIHTWAFAADYLDGIGLNCIWDRTVALSQRLKLGVRALPASKLFTPDDPEFSAALVAFGIGGIKGDALCEALRHRWNIVTKPLPHTREGLRVSLSFFNTEEEVDLLLQALGSLASGQA